MKITWAFWIAIIGSNISPQMVVFFAMSQLNKHFTYLHQGYLFYEIAKHLDAFKKKNPLKQPINLGVGDVALPLVPEIADAIAHATREMTTPEGLHGYGPGCGDPRLREAISKKEYAQYGITPEEIFISEGINDDICDISDLFSKDCKIAIPDPVYPVYVASNVIDGRTGPPDEAGYYKEITYLPCREENRFLPIPPEHPVDIIYLCSPNNPTGAAFTYDELANWVAWAKKNRAIILYDAAYKTFLLRKDKPRCIYAINGAKEVAIEFSSFSKTAGFTGLRLGYVTIPDELLLFDGDQSYQARTFWENRQETKTNGVSYPIQMGGLATLDPEVEKKTKAQIAIYQESSKLLRQALDQLGQTHFGGEDSPYIWWKIPNNTSSWDYFSYLLNQTGIISIPGVGFGKEGEGYVRLSSFCSIETAHLAAKALHRLFDRPLSKEV